MRRLVLLTTVSCLAIGMGAWVMAQDPAAKPKHTIKEVMKEAHGQKLLNKVLDGAASKEEKDKLLDLYLSMLENQPSRGDQSGWIMRSGGLIVSTARVAVGREGALDELKTASNCKACHDAHK
jgi:hypothetical protein